MRESWILLFLTVTLVLCVLTFEGRAAERWTLTSPDEQLCLTVMLADGTGDSAGKARLYYTIEHGRRDTRCEALRRSPLGIRRADQAFVDGLRFVAAGDVETIDEQYSLVHGKRRVCHVLANRQTLTFANAEGAKLDVEFHVANDGAAFRYCFLQSDVPEMTVTGEETGFRIPDDSLAWIEPYDVPSKWTPAYEKYFDNGIAAGTSSETDSGWAFPGLFHTPATDRWVLLTEAAVDETYCGSRLQQTVTDNVYRIRFPQQGEGNGVGQVLPHSTHPWRTPWRVILVADSLAGIVESTLVTDLNPPCALGDTDWIHPARVSWSWWSDHDSPQDYDSLCDFVDLAAEMGWEYSLVDANWNLMDGGNVRELARYAAEKGVGLFLWYNSGGAHNIVTEKPRGCLTQGEVRRFEFELLNKWGVKGVKVDFFHSDKQDMMELYLGILKDAADHKLMVNFHGCTLPRGWSRTYPNLMSMESVRGAECYTFASEYPEKAPWHNTILPFTRNVVGPMDYTPVAFTNGGYARRTTVGHELALAIVFESGLLHLADRTSAYRSLPATPRKLLETVPVVWDETRYVAGYPGKYVVLARRSGDRWYLAGINGQHSAREMQLDLSFLGDRQYDVTWIEDGPNDSFTDRQSTETAEDAAQISMPPRGGFVAQITPNDS